MVKYTPLENYFRKQPLSTTQIVLTFAKIEGIIANKLPNSARQYFSFWARYGEGTGISKAYSNAGFEIVMIDKEYEKVRFRRIGS